MPKGKQLRLDVAALTDIGCKRSNNEDSFGYDTESHIYIVCDGMGGMNAGEIASSTAVSKLIELFRGSTHSSDCAALLMEERLHAAIVETNRIVRELAQANDRMRGMGTTLVAACFDGERIVIANVGDSQAYFLRNDGCVQITLDHSLLAEQVRNGVMTLADAATSPLQSVITRAIGTADSVEPDFFAAEPDAGDVILLNTDGLARYVNALEIAQLVGNSEGLEAACSALIATAKERGAADNVTCLLLKVRN